MTGISTLSGVERRLVSLVNVAVDFASRSMAWPRTGKRLAVAMVDTVLGVAAVWIAFSLRLGEFHKPDAALAVFTIALLGLWFPIALLRGVYRTIFRFSGRGAIISLMIAAILVTLPLIAVFMVFPQPDVPRTMAILGPLVFFLLVTLSRIVGRYVMVDLFAARLGGDQTKRVVIYGAGASGERLAGALASEAGMQVVGFVDDDASKAGHYLDGKKVHHSGDIAGLIARREVSDIVIAISNVSFSRRKQIIAALQPLPVNVQTLPVMREVFEGRVNADALRPIEVEDLLGRSPVPEHGDLLSRQVSGRLVMVTGAGGSIGSEICRQILAQKPAGLVMVDVNEFALFNIGRELEQALESVAEPFRPRLYQRLADVSSEAAVARLFAEFAPQTIFHAAAYKHVPMVEDNVIEAVRNNVLGARAMAQAAQKSGTHRFVLISTDKAVRPPNVMGASKRVCEVVLQDLARGSQGAGTVFSMVRFGNVLGSSGSVVPIFQRQIEAGGPVTVTHREVTRYFMTIFEAAQLVIQAGAMARGGEVFLLDMGEPVRIWDLARSMINLAGLKVRDEANPDGDIEIVERGLRPGEKLFEELLLDENSAPTEHPRIMQGSEHCPAPMVVASVLQQLEEAIAAGDELACKAALKVLVPTLDCTAPMQTLHTPPLRTPPAIRLGPSRPATQPVAQPAEPAQQPLLG